MNKDTIVYVPVQFISQTEKNNYVWSEYLDCFLKPVKISELLKELDEHKDVASTSTGHLNTNNS
jgi:hypothetical protein